MTDNQVKEIVSEAFVRLILARDRFKISKPESDHGVDLTICPVDIITLPNGEIMYEDSGRRLDIQLKCTTLKSIKMTETHVEYNLRYKNYYALKQKAGFRYVKMILVLLVLPDEETEWINVIEDELVFKKNCYWFVPEDGDIPPELILKSKEDKVKIEIPRGNHVLEFKRLFNKIVGE